MAAGAGRGERGTHRRSGDPVGYRSRCKSRHSHHAIRASKSCPGTKINIPGQLLDAQAPEAPVAPPEVVLVRVGNLRRGLPGTTAPIATVLSAGAIYQPVAITAAGERVAGNSFWYRDADYNFLWAGATNFPNGA